MSYQQFDITNKPNYHPAFPYIVEMATPDEYCTPEKINEMSEWCNSLTDHWGYTSWRQTFMFAFEEHKNWFIMRWL